MDQLLGTLGIDWRLFIGQIVNFLIFLVILRVFAYKPLLEVMEKRRKRIEEGLDNASKQEGLIAQIEEQKNQVLKEAREQAESLLAETRKKSEDLQQNMMRQAEERVKALQERAEVDINKQKENVRNELRTYAGTLAISISEKILKERIDPAKEEVLIKEMLQKM